MRKKAAETNKGAKKVTKPSVAANARKAIEERYNKKKDKKNYVDL